MKPQKQLSLRLKSVRALVKLPKGADSPEEVTVWLCRAYACWGLSNRAIKMFLGLSDGQIYKICKAWGIKRKHYRDAMRKDPDISSRMPTAGGNIALQLVERLDRMAERRLVDHIEKYLLK